MTLAGNGVAPTLKLDVCRIALDGLGFERPHSCYHRPAAEFTVNADIHRLICSPAIPA